MSSHDRIDSASQREARSGSPGKRLQTRCMKGLPQATQCSVTAPRSPVLAHALQTHLSLSPSILSNMYPPLLDNY